jgi:hypothetical protein
MSVDATEEINQSCYHAGPSGLLADPNIRSIIDVKVLEEQDIILPTRIWNFSVPPEM